MADYRLYISEINDEQQLQQMLQQTDDDERRLIITDRLRHLSINRQGQSQVQGDSHLHNDVTVNNVTASNSKGGSSDKDAVEEQGVARTTRTEKTSDGGRTTTTTTTTTHKTKDGNHLITKQTRQITRVGDVGCTNYPLNKVPAEAVLDCLVKTFQSKPVAGLAGVISVRTESWNSKDGVVVRSHKSQAIGDDEENLPTSGQSREYRLPPNTAELQPTHMSNYSPAQCDMRPQRITVQRNATSIKQVLLDWCQTRVHGYKGVNVVDFSSSWSDGMAFCALVHSYYPNAFDFNQLDANNRRHNFQLAFDTAQSRADIEPLLNVEDMLSTTTPDWRYVFSYVQSIYRRLAAINRPRPLPDDVATTSPQ